MRIWNNAILFFFLEFFKTYISLLVHIVLYKRRRGGGKKTISRLLSFYRQNNDDSIFFFCFHVKFVRRVETWRDIDRNKYFEGFEFMVEIYTTIFFRSWWRNVAVAWGGFGEIDTTRAPNALKVGTASSSWTWTSTTSFETSRCCCVHAVDSRVHSLLPRFAEFSPISENGQTDNGQGENLSGVYLLQISDKE